jgi:hypothetical protein
MATVQEVARGPSRHETFVDAEIARASRRIRAHDIGVAALQLVLGILVYALLMILLDRWLDLPARLRQFALIGFLAGCVLQAVIVLSRPFRRRVNPYYAARQVERAVPAAKNSVVNWLDLRDEPLPSTIKSALGARAASDLTKADFDEVLRDRRLGWLGGVVGALVFTALLLFFILRPAQFTSLVGLAFAPFASTAIARQTELEMIQPAGGNVTVPVNQSVEFRVLVHGRNPSPEADDSVRLRMRYNPADPVWEERRLDPTTREPREWAVRVPAVAVQNGFVYQIVGSDAATPEYRVSVRSSPLIEGFDIRYHFRPYLRFPVQIATNPNLESLRGTQVTMTVKTNRRIKEGWLRFDKTEGEAPAANHSIAAELVPELPNALRFQFTLERDGKYRVHFTSLEGDENQDPIPYSITVLNDHRPQVEITRSAPEGLAINGTLSLEGKASDDFGITKLRLCGRLLANDGDRQPMALADRAFRDGKSFQFDDGTFPRALDYKEALPLVQWKSRSGIAPTLKAGAIIEYWLEAEDNYDHPKPNVGQSKVHRVVLGEPKAEDERMTAEEQAKADKKDFDQKQDEQLKNENAAKKNEPQPPQDQGQDPKPDNADPKGDPPPPQDQQANPPKDAQQQAEEKKAEDLAKKLQEKLREKQNDAQQPKGEAKPDQEGNPNQGDAKPQPNQQGSDKGDAKPDAANPNQPNNDPKGEQKPDQKSQSGADKGSAKPEGKPEQAPEPGEAKPQCVDPKKESPDGVPMPNPDSKNSNQQNTKPDQPPGANPQQGDSKNQDAKPDQKNSAQQGDSK